MEKWKEIKDFDDYWVSTQGRVWSEKRKIIMKQSVGRGYYYVTLWHNNKTYRKLVNRLVAQAFIPNPENKEQVDHINAIKTDNRVENLRWCTAKENINFKSKESLDKGKENGVRYCSKAIVERINDEISIAYLNQHRVPNMKQNTLSYHVSKGKAEFTCKGRTFIYPNNVLQ